MRMQHLIGSCAFHNRHKDQRREIYEHLRSDFVDVSLLSVLCTTDWHNLYPEAKRIMSYLTDCRRNAIRADNRRTRYRNQLDNEGVYRFVRASKLAFKN